MAFKIAYAAGHCLTTAGKRLPKKLDPQETREWVLNDRVARHFAAAAMQYEGVELLRLDDPAGKVGILVEDRAQKANQWGADFLLEIHHNAGINLGKGGGMVAFSYRDNPYRDAIYDACIAAGGLKGNRASPKQTKAYTILKTFQGPGVLMEYGFMDSKTDAPVILTEAYSKLVAYATMEAVARVAGLKKKQQETKAMCKVELPVLAKGYTGQSVKAMQTLLTGYGCDATGKFGTVTEQAVQVFQKAKGLTPSGKCGEKTWSALLGVTA